MSKSDVSPEAIIAEHTEQQGQRWMAPDGVYMRCRCGAAMHPVEHAAHVVSRLSEHGYSIVPSAQTFRGPGELDELPVGVLVWVDSSRIPYHKHSNGNWSPVPEVAAAALGIGKSQLTSRGLLGGDKLCRTATLAAAAAAEEDQ